MTHSGVQTQRRWVFGPASDLLLGCGLAYVLVFGVHSAVGESLQSAVPMWALIVGSLLLSGPHYGATLLRVYEQRHDRREYALFAVWASAAILGVFVWGLYDYAVGSLLIMLYLSWSPWHYSGQSYGITRMFLHRRGVEVTPAARRLLRASFTLSFLLALFAFHGLGSSASYAPNPGESYLSGYVYGSASLGIPDPWQDAALVLLAVAYLGTLGGALVLLLRRASVATLAPALVLIGAQGIWFSLPALARNWGLLAGVEPLSTRHVQYSFLWIAMAHAVQYPWITAYYARQSGRSRHHSLFYLKALAAGTLIWTVPALVFAPQVLGGLPYDLGLGLMVASAVNLHHFVLDGAIWKLRNTRVAGVLLRRQ